MKKIADVSLITGAVSLIAGVISRLITQPLGGVYASAFLQFAAVCILLAIALMIREK